MIKCIELGKSFETKEELFAELKANKENIIALKTAAVKQSDGIRAIAYREDSALKVDTIKLEDGFIYPVINTTKILDSHRDMHDDGIWTKTISEQKGRIHYTTNHELKIGSIIAYPADVSVSVKELNWSSLGKGYEGTTEALIFKVRINDYANQDAIRAIDKKLPVQNSVSMIYKKLELAINSEEKEYKDEKAVFDKYYEKIANKDEWPELDYFWVVKEAAIAREGSMVPLGSNQATPILYPNKNEPQGSTRTKEVEAEKNSLSPDNMAFIKAMNELLTIKN